MAQKPVANTELQVAVKAVAEYGIGEAAKMLGIPRTTLQSRMGQAERAGITAEGSEPKESPHIQQRVKVLEAELRLAKGGALDAAAVKHEIIGLAKHASQLVVPDWVVSPPKSSHSPGVPTLFASDWHWGEVVDSTQIGGVNRYNMAIARERAKTLIETTIDLLNNHMVNPEYPGIVFALGGDMVTGDIHEELSATNDAEIMPVVLDLFGVLCWCIETLAKEFGRVFVPCVSGNHGRNTHKIRSKGRNFTSFDWLTYSFLAKRFENDERVKFFTPNGSDALYECAGRRYLLTHGDQFRGGDGMIGCLGPILRGDHKKRSRNGQIDMGYDTMIMGHWHQLLQLERVIVNGSLKGYDEYASQNNFGFEAPRQALWITNAQHGITFSMPVSVDKTKAVKVKQEWVGWTE